MDKPNYYQRSRDVLLKKSKECYRNNRERIINNYKSLSEDEKNYRKEYRKNMCDKQKQRYKEARNKRYKDKHHSMTDKEKQKKKDYQKEHKKT